MSPKSFVRQYRTVVPAGFTTYGLYGSALPATTRVCYDRIVACDTNGKPTIINFGFKRGADSVNLGSQIPTVVGQGVFVRGKLYVPGDYVPFASFVGVNQDDVLTLTVYGYTTDTIP